MEISGNKNNLRILFEAEIAKKLRTAQPQSKVTGSYKKGLRELKQRGRERQLERYKTIDLVTEYNHFTWECNHLPTFLPSSLESERENLISGVFLESVNVRLSTNHFNLHAALKTKLLTIHIHTHSGKTKKRMSYTKKKRENGKLKIQ